MATFGPLSADRFQQLLISDPSFAVGFVLNNNWEGVADRCYDVGLNRPLSKVTAEECVQTLLSKGEDAAFVDVMSVDLDTEGMPMEYRQVLLTMVQLQGGNTVVAGGLPSQRITNTIAQQALANYKRDSALVDADASNGMGDAGTDASGFLDFYKPKTPTDPKRKRMMKALLWGGAIILGIIAIALIIRYAKK